MTLKRISNEKILSMIMPLDTQSVSKGKLIAQAQLEACEKEHKAVIKSLFEEIENTYYRPHIAGKISTSDLVEAMKMWQALKQKYGGE